MIWFRFRAHLEKQLLDQARLYTLVLSNKDRIIQWQVDEIQRLRARCERLELSLTPPPRTEHKTPPKAKAVAIEGETAWLAYLNRYMADEEKKDVPVKDGAGVHESAGSDAPRPDVGAVKADAAAGAGKQRPA